MMSNSIFMLRNMNVKCAEKNLEIAGGDEINQTLSSNTFSCIGVMFPIEILRVPFRF